MSRQDRTRSVGDRADIREAPDGDIASHSWQRNMSTFREFELRTIVSGEQDK